MSHTNTPQETGFESNKDNIEIMTGYEREQQQNFNPSNNEGADGFNYEYNKSSEILHAGESPEKGNYSCTNCGTDITLTDNEKLPACPRCGNTEFRREM